MTPKQRACRMWRKRWTPFMRDCILIAAALIALVYYVFYELGNMYLKP